MRNNHEEEQRLKDLTQMARHVQELQRQASEGAPIVEDAIDAVRNLRASTIVMCSRAARLLADGLADGEPIGKFDECLAMLLEQTTLIGKIADGLTIAGYREEAKLQQKEKDNV